MYDPDFGAQRQRPGNRLDPSKHVQLEYDVDAERIEISITDEGEGFDPCCIPDPTCDENLEKPCGRGIMLIRAYMDEVRYRDDGREVYFVKRRK